jgi:hypothetical protein
MQSAAETLRKAALWCHSAEEWSALGRKFRWKANRFWWAPRPPRRQWFPAGRLPDYKPGQIPEPDEIPVAAEPQRV